MSQSAGVQDITFKADADLSSKQFYFVILDADGKASVSGENGVVLGILQNKPSAEDKAALVRTVGTSKLKMNEACDEGEWLTSTSAGLGEVCDTADEYCGAMALEASGAQNDIIEVLVIHAYSPASHA